MDKLRCYTIFILCCMFTIFPFTDGVGNGNGDGAGQPNLEGHKRILSFPDMLRNMLSFPKTSPITTTSTRHWEKVKTLINQVHTYFFYPNIDFRSGDEAEANGAGGGSTGVKVRVKEAVAKSLDKSKATVEDSAKTAAEIVGETVKKTNEKVKNSLSEREAESQSEL
ncbi:hypothetical protein FCV25MIE_33619 [Fagus crenata]